VGTQISHSPADRAQWGERGKEMSDCLQSGWGRVVMMLCLLGPLAGGRATAAADFGLSVTGAPNPALVSQPVTYNIAVTNQTGFTLTVVFLTNEFSAPVQFLSATNTIPVTLATNANTV